jgi:trimethylamine:corrinoid methyltransferase-like protein
MARRGRRRAALEAEEEVDLSRAPTYDPLTPEQVDRILNAVFELLRDSGVWFEPEPRSQALLSDAGCDISADGVVKFPTEVVKEALDSVAKSCRLWNRSGTDSIELKAGNTFFSAGITCINVYDPETGERRPSSREDLINIARVTDALPNIDSLTLPCKIVERSDVYGEIEEFSLMLKNTSKPLEFLCEHEVTLRAAIEMAIAVRGGAGTLCEKPYFIHGVTPLPLQYPKTHIDQLFTAVENGIPLGVGTFSIGGATTPYTIAGSLVHAFTSDFAGLVLGQLIARGSFCLIGTNISFMDPATGALGGFPHSALAELAQGQIARRLGMPNGFTLAGSSEGRKLDFEAISRAPATMLQAFLGRPTTCDCVGSLDAGLTFSFELLVLANDLVELAHCMQQGIQVDDDTLALAESKEVGPRGDFLSLDHTVKHCRRHQWKTRYFRQKPGLTPEEQDEIDIMAWIKDDLRDILENYRSEPLSEQIAKEVDAILVRYGAG